LPAHVAFDVKARLKKNPKARPGSDLKKALQDKLHAGTFQNSREISNCVKLMGVPDFWRSLTVEMGGTWSSESIQEKLNAISGRRNMIVHEADLERKISTSRFALREITREMAQESYEFLNEFVCASDTIIDRSL
jgi:hypothetical protein